MQRPRPVALPCLAANAGNAVPSRGHYSASCASPLAPCGIWEKKRFWGARCAAWPVVGAPPQKKRKRQGLPEQGYNQSLHVRSTGPSRFCSPALVALRRLVFLNAGHRWWGARMGPPPPLARAPWSYNSARGTLLRDSLPSFAERHLGPH
jgi:hypothetical protein